jgi:rSAM/selenodomain-associated transferase 2
LVIAGSAPAIHYGAVLRHRCHRPSEIIVAMSKLSIIMPVLDEGDGIAAALDALADLRALGTEVIVVDGGSRDGTADRARPLADQVLTAARGRAAQMNAGAAVASGDVLWFVHADTALPAGADAMVTRAVDTGGQWGRFDVAITGSHRLLPVVAAMMNLRSRLTGIATGDQAIFVTRAAFEAAGRYPPIALMEDVALSRALKRQARPCCLAARIVTSGRRWEKNGIWRTIFLMWRLRLAYALGADPAGLAVRYGYRSRQG